MWCTVLDEIIGLLVPVSILAALGVWLIREHEFRGAICCKAFLLYLLIVELLFSCQIIRDFSIHCSFQYFWRPLLDVLIRVFLRQLLAVPKFLSWFGNWQVLWCCSIQLSFQSISLNCSCVTVLGIYSQIPWRVAPVFRNSDVPLTLESWMPWISRACKGPLVLRDLLLLPLWFFFLAQRSFFCFSFFFSEHLFLLTFVFETYFCASSFTSSKARHSLFLAFQLLEHLHLLTQHFQCSACACCRFQTSFHLEVSQQFFCYLSCWALCSWLTSCALATPS